MDSDSISIGSSQWDKYSSDDDGIDIDMEQVIDDCKHYVEEKMNQWLEKQGSLLFKKLAIEHLMKLEKKDLESLTTKEIKKEITAPKTQESISIDIPRGLS